MKLLKDKKFWIIVAVTTVVVAVVVYFARKKKSESVLAPAASPAVTSETVLPDRNIFPLKFGSRGEEVKAVQKYVNSQKPMSSSTPVLPALVIDGIWGQKTQDAVKYKLGLNEIDYTYYTKIILGIR